MGDVENADNVVTWHVMVWILLTLAISSMSQPAGRLFGRDVPRRYRVYLCVSPVICMLDALWIVLLFVRICGTLETTPRRAARSIALARFERSPSEEQDTRQRPTAQDSWPRWILFVIGTLPALIKLASFSHVPWIKTFGMMYGGSYLLIEGFEMLAPSDTEDMPESFFVELNWPIDKRRLAWRVLYYGRANRILRKRLVPDEELAILILLPQIALDAWLFWGLWKCLDRIDTDRYQDWYNLFAAVIISTMLLSMSISFCLWIYSEMDPSRRGPRVRFRFRHFLQFTVFLNVALAVRDRNAENLPIMYHNTKSIQFITVACFGALLFWYVYRVLLITCRTFPPLARKLLVRPLLEVEVVVSSSSPSSTVDVPQISSTTRSPDEVASQLETGVGGTSSDEPGSSTTTMQYKEELDSLGVLSLSFFTFHLGLVVTWFALVYDPTGTVNPAWTDVFG